MEKIFLTISLGTFRPFNILHLDILQYQLVRPFQSTKLPNYRVIFFAAKRVHWKMVYHRSIIEKKRKLLLTWQQLEIALHLTKRCRNYCFFGVVKKGETKKTRRKEREEEMEFGTEDSGSRHETWGPYWRFCERSPRPLIINVECRSLFSRTRGPLFFVTCVRHYVRNQ